jgi:cytochrome c oxidase cbb3-type subunit 2
MPAYPWLAETNLKPAGVTKKMNVLRMLGHPYTDEQIAAGPAMLEGKNELDALIAYLQVLGTAGRGVQ